MRLARTARAVPEPLTDDRLDIATEHALLARHVLAYRLDGPLFFAVADRFLREITATTSVQVVILRLGSVAMLDATGARVLGEIVENLHRQGITVLVKGASAEHRRLLAAVGTLAPLIERDTSSPPSTRPWPTRPRTSPPTPTGRRPRTGHRARSVPRTTSRSRRSPRPRSSTRAEREDEL